MADGVRISIPSSATKAEEEKYVESLLRKYERRKQSTDIDLTERAAALSQRYRLRTPSSIRWAENQNTRWGSCTPDMGTIRISANVSSFPTWVLDYVIVHELAHLSVPGYGSRFWELVERYPKCERARGFLIAKGLDGDDAPGDEEAIDDERS